MTPKPTFLPTHLRAAYQLRYHFSWCTKRRKPILATQYLRSKVEETIRRVSENAGYHLLGLDVEPNVVLCLLSLVPSDSPESITRKIKGNVATELRADGVHNLWSRGWFVRSNGNVTNEIIQTYIANQIEHHRAAPVENRSTMEKCRHHLDEDIDQIRKSSHAAFQYNVHFVFCVRKRFHFLDPVIGGILVQYLLAVCKRKGWIAWDIEVVWDHVHLLIGLTPTSSPEEVALSLLNNAEFWLFDRYRAAIKMDELETVFQAGYYAGTCGAATTAQIQSFLESQVTID